MNSGVDIVTVKELLGHSSISVTMRYAHTNFDSKRSAVEKLDGFGDNLVTVRTKMQQSRVGTVTKSGCKLQCFKNLISEGWVSG